ncbi:beta-galactosidase [Planctomycetota bacterium]
MKNVRMPLAIAVTIMLFSCVEGHGKGTLKSNVHLGMAFPPISREAAREMTAKALKELNIKWLRTEIHWRTIEEKKGQYNWSGLDAKMKWIADNNLNAVMTIATAAPDWAALEKNEKSAVYRNTDDFRTFVTAVARRYADRIKIVQYGNEWHGVHWFIGTPEQFVEYNNIAYDVFKQHSPTTRFCLGGFATGSLRAMSLYNGKIGSYRHGITGEIVTREKWDRAGKKQKKKIDQAAQRITHVARNAKYDMVDIHLYDDPENWKIYHDMVKELCGNKKVIVTEFGGPNQKYQKYDEDFHVKELRKYIEAIDSLDIKIALHFYMVEGDALHGKSALFRIDGKDPSSALGLKIVKKKTWAVLYEYSKNQN